MTIWEAARATSAAPTFFEPLILPSDNNSQWVDGGLIVNNPAEQILQEVKKLWGEPEQRFDLKRIGLFLSIGTGVAEDISLQGGFLNDISTRMRLPSTLLKAIVTRTFDCEGVNQKMYSHFGELPRTEKRYHRFSTEGIRDIVFYDYKKMPTIKERTLNYLNGGERQEGLDQCALQAISVFVDPLLADVPQL